VRNAVTVFVNRTLASDPEFANVSERDSMKTVFAYEHFFPPFDEGVKKFSYMLHQEMTRSHDVALIRNLAYVPGFVNSLLIVPRILLLALVRRPDRVVYVPKGALTFPSLVRIWMLGKILGQKLSVVGVQRKKLSAWQHGIICNLRFGGVFVLSTAMAKEVSRLGIQAKILNIGIDRERYAPAGDTSALREKYGVPLARPVLLHVGHIRESRNIRWLLQVQQALPHVQVLLVGSTATEQEDALCEELVRAGVIVLRKFIPDIQEVYQLSSWYCFPVLNDDGAMETPLSILESMAVDLPVISTRFGRLPELFAEDDCYRYVGSSAEIIELLRSGFGRECHNRPKTEPYTWRAAVDALLSG
jgi:glycosyltransferase involved in cell wall biosynthesis